MPFTTLTRREKFILLMITEGKTNSQIADSMGYARGSMRNYVSAILDKLGCENRAQLAVYAVRNGLESTHFWEDSPQGAKGDNHEQVMELYDRIARHSPRTAAEVIEVLS